MMSEILFAWPFSVLLKKTGFGHRTAKSQPIWIKFCTRPIVVRNTLVGRLDRDRRVGGSRPNQNVFFVILETHPKSYIETRRIAAIAISAVNRQEWR